MSIRLARPSESEFIHRMGFDAWGEGRTIEAYLAACRAAPKYAAGEWWVGVGDDGFVECSLLLHEIPLPDGPPAAGLGSIATVPALRGRGHGSNLIAEVIGRREASAGTKVFFLFSDIAPAFYAKFGFAVIGPCSKKPSSIIMARAAPATLADLLADPRFRLPEYF